MKKTPSKPKSKAKRKSASKRATQPKTLSSRISDGVDKLAGRVGNLFSSRPADLVAAIKLDHEGLRNFLGTLKDTDAEMTERRRAYAQFSALLKSHSEVEEKVAYKAAIRLPGRELHLKTAEGFVEHRLADDVMARLESTTEPMEWSAHANVLSEIVEHHLKEEERDLLPLIRKATPASAAQAMLAEYLKLRKQTQPSVTDQNAGALDRRPSGEG